MKTKVKYLLILLLSFIFINKVNALSVDTTNITLNKGESKTIDVYENVDESVKNVSFSLVFTTYDVTAGFTVDSKYTDEAPSPINHNVILNGTDTGHIKIGTIEINASSNPKGNSGIVRIGGIEINVTINDINEVNTVPTDNIIDYNLLKEIKSDIVNINLKKDVFDYDIIVNNDITTLDLVPVPISSEYNVEISSQEVKDNSQIVIKVSNNKIEKEYKINVKVKSKSKYEDIYKDYVNEERKEFKYKYKIILAIILLLSIMFIGIILNRKK